ncbi:hypothetical protein PssB301D_02657 [Pseudomonas syringae pv. syringae str. B301D-R]|nr:hypothetical protein PssB301D_02657 [Pseudomonas syringae pv. syringae str. B301D-R]
MTVDNHLQSLNEGVQALAVIKGELALQHIGVADLGCHVVIKNAFLQRRQRVDILNIRHAAGHAGHHLVDLHLGQTCQRQQLWSDALAALANQVGRYIDFTACADGGGQCGQRGLAEQHAYIGAQPRQAHALYQADGQQRVPAQLKEVIVTTDALNVEQFGPQARQGDFHFTLGCLEFAAGVGIGVRYRQGPAIKLAVGGQRERVQHHKGAWHHVFGQRRRRFAAQFDR